MSDASDDGLGFNDDSAGSLNATLRMLLASGSYQLWANADDEETGDYTLLSLPGPSNVTGCIDIWIMAGLEATQSLTANDCLTDGFYSDQYLIWLTAGARVTISMDSAKWTPISGSLTSPATFVGRTTTAAPARMPDWCSTHPPHQRT